MVDNLISPLDIIGNLASERRMTMPELVTPKFVDLKTHPAISETWLQERLETTPGLLGNEFENAAIRDSQRRQPSGGRLDLLLQGDDDTRYEVEIQLGSLDESHIIRAIEYWDIERRRYPQYNHVAVIVAEEITGRFLNVISLFNGAIPMIAIQMRGVEVAGKFTLIATRVLDVVTMGTEEEDEGEATDRAYWNARSSPAGLEILDGLLNLTQEVQPNANPKYNKHYIGLNIGGQARNFLEFVPKKGSCNIRFKLPSDPELDDQMDKAGLIRLSYDSSFKRYQVRVLQQDLDERREPLRHLMIQARDAMPGLTHGDP